MPVLRFKVEPVAQHKLRMRVERIVTQPFNETERR